MLAETIPDGEENSILYSQVLTFYPVNHVHIYEKQCKLNKSGKTDLTQILRVDPHPPLLHTALGALFAVFAVNPRIFFFL